MYILADPQQGVSSRKLNLFFALSNQKGLYAMSILADPPQGTSSRDLNLFFALSNQIGLCLWYLCTFCLSNHKGPVLACVGSFA